jgi:ATP-dependent DNA helicase RecG
MRLTEAVVEDADGGALKAVWFNQPHLARRFPAGTRLALAGVVAASRFASGLEMRNPRWEVLAATSLMGRASPDFPGHIGSVMPRYRLTAGLTQRKVAALVEQVLPLADQMSETLPPAVRQRRGLISIGDAIRLGHRPSSELDFEMARRRVLFAELFELQVAFLVARRTLAAEEATPIPYRQDVIDAFKLGLKFELTNAQRRAIWQVFLDIQEAVPANRLLNGDVGSGKTVVAAAAMAMAHAAGLQSVMMAPTEILARQHLSSLRMSLEGTFPDLKVDLLVGGLPAAERRRVAMATASGHSAVVVGTHALIEDSIEFARLGLAVVDEQHRFGTRQREMLRRKGHGRPHFMAMTATPIPRSMVLAMYGEMAVSILDEMPAGRKRIATRVLGPEERSQAYQVVREQVAMGRQAFVICPLIEESDTVEFRAATVEYERLRTEVFPDLRLALVHGRVKDKERVMRDFSLGNSDILVATAVVEVGVDIPNASVMMIEGAERFGLAQLHQFRGRVGRGSHPSYCLLLSDEPDSADLDRLQFMVDIDDGFKLAEKDLELRGAGQLIGARQHGVTDSAMEALRNPALLNEARQEAEAVLDGDRLPQALLEAVDRRLAATSIS